MKRSVERKIIEGLESFADALEKGEDISQRFTSRRVTLKVSTSDFDPDRVRKARAVIGASQTVFAQFLGVAPGTVRAWEQGEKKPMPIACRFMDEILHDPNRWRKRFRELLVPKRG